VASLATHPMKMMVEAMDRAQEEIWLKDMLVKKAKWVGQRMKISKGKVLRGMI